MNPRAEKSPPFPSRGAANTLAVCGLLALAVLAVFVQTARFEFINLDDDLNIYNNPHVTAGATLQGLGWAFLHPSGTDYWRPLCFLTHMLDCQFFGLWAGGHHLVNVLIHAAAVVTLFLVLRGMTGRTWPSALAAAVFAIHPLRVESVAWVTERKDVLAALFFMLTLGAYVRYVRRPTPGRYAAAVVVYAVGLMCKASLIPLPLVLVLLDYWPLGRGEKKDAETRRTGGRVLIPHPSFIPHPSSFQGWGALLLEKVPFFALSAVSCVICLSTGGGVMEYAGQIPRWIRAGWAVNSAVTYLAAFFWPAGLLPWYQNPQGPPAVWASALALAGISAAVIALRRRAPWLFTGWFWYLAMLLPTVTMSQARIDRFTYLSQIGVCVALTWLCADLAARWRVARMVQALAAAGAVAALMIAANGLCAGWRDNPTLWGYVVKCEPHNLLAHFILGGAELDRGNTAEAKKHFRMIQDARPDDAMTNNNLGTALLACGEVEAALAEFRRALDFQPKFDLARCNLARALASQGHLDEAIAEYRKAVAIKPEFAEARCGLAEALASQGHIDEAVAEYQKALEYEAASFDAHIGLGNALSRVGRIDAAIEQYRMAVKVRPRHAGGYHNLGMALVRRGRIGEAIAALREAVKIQPDYLEALNNLGGALAIAGRNEEAMVYYRKALEIDPDNVQALSNLGDALAGSGRIREALDRYQKATGLAAARNDKASVKALEGRIRRAQAADRAGKSP